MITKPANDSFIPQRQLIQFQEISMTEIEAPSLNFGKKIKLEDTERDEKIIMTAIKPNVNIYKNNN